jgi:perosamine synthetase
MYIIKPVEASFRDSLTLDQGHENSLNSQAVDISNASKSIGVRRFMWVRLQLDFDWSDFTYGISRLGLPIDRAAVVESIVNRWSPQGNVLPVLSVRSGFDLFLSAMQWSAQSEIVFSALNIPDMAMVARRRGLVPVPADLDVERLAPDIGLLEQAITPRTKAILIAHMYGNFVPLEPVVALARRRGLMLIEDAAEIYDGVYTGHPDADVSLFSFGPLKTATSLAGGIVRTRDPELLARMRAIHERWPIQSRLDQFKRLCKYGTMKFFGARWIFATTRRLARLVVGDVDKMIHHTAKSFRENEIMGRLRQQPCGPLLASLARRFANFDHARIRQRTANGKLLTALLRGKVICPGAEVEPHNYWLYPVLVTDPAKTLTALAEAGFDATQVQTMRPIDAPPDRPELTPTRVADALPHMILVPCYPGIPEAELRRMADVLIRVEGEAGKVSALKATLQPADTAYSREKKEAELPQGHNQLTRPVANS